MKKITFKQLTAAALAVPLALGLTASSVAAQITNPVLPKYGTDSTGASSGSLLFTIISAVLGFVMLIASLLVLLNLVEAAINWISSGGDSGKLQKSRDRILHSIIGIIMLSASVAIWNLVLQFLGIKVSFAQLFGGSSSAGSAGVQVTPTKDIRSSGPSKSSTAPISTTAPKSSGADSLTK